MTRFAAVAAAIVIYAIVAMPLLNVAGQVMA